MSVRKDLRHPAVVAQQLRFPDRVICSRCTMTFIPVDELRKPLRCPECARLFSAPTTGRQDSIRCFVRREDGT